MLGIVEHRGDLWMGAGQHRGDLAELFLNVFRIGLSKNGADDRGHHVLRALRDDGEHVAHEMHSASLPACALEHGAD